MIQNYLARVRAIVAILAIGVLPLLVAGCGLFGGEDEVEPPAELVEFKATTKVRKLWSTKVGKDAQELRLGLAPVSDAVRVYAASREGQVHALEPLTGKTIWTTKLKLTLTAGPGVGDNRVVVTGSDGDVIALNATTGEQLWKRRVAAEVLATPAIGGERVVLRSADGRLIALNGRTGEQEWLIEESVPRLSLRGTASPVISANFVVCGFDNGRLMAIDLIDGTVAWEQLMTPPSGKTDLERLVDIDGAVAAVGRDVYVTGFRGKVAALALESGQGLWSREVSSYHGPGVDWVHAYVVTEDGDVVALQRSNGVEKWRNDQLKRRELSAPTPFGDAVVVGDLEGYLHWLDASTGELTARTRVDKSRLSGRMEAEGDTLYVQTESGVVAAFQVPAADES